MSKRRNSLSNDQASDSLLSSFIRGLHDYFNPLLHVIEELESDAKNKRKK
ncbi:MAG: hypothetical protein WCB79_11230 [Halobacteriota archaeon]